MAGNKGNKDLLRKALIGFAGFLGVPLVPAQESVLLSEHIPGGRASASIKHMRPSRWLDEARTIPDPESYYLVHEETSHNLIMNEGRDFMHTQCYGTSGLLTNGLNYIALSNTTVTVDPTQTTLAGEITTNGLGRAQGAVAHTTSTNTTTISKTFTCSTAQQAAKTAGLFNLSSGGKGNHFLAFTQRTLEVGDTLAVTFTITMG